MPPWDPNVIPNLWASLWWGLLIGGFAWLARTWIRDKAKKVIEKHVTAPLKAHVDSHHELLHRRLDAAGVPRQPKGEGTHE